MAPEVKRLNLGCGPDIKEGWINVDKPGLGHIMKEAAWDMLDDPRWDLLDCDFILVNHVLCTMDYWDVQKALTHIRGLLRTGGKVQVIDVDLLKAFRAYENNDSNSLPTHGDIDEQLCTHLSGFGTRLSLFTEKQLSRLLLKAGFSSVEVLESSEYDTRPSESLIVEATK